MRKFIIPDVETFIAAIQDEISRTLEGRYFHRLTLFFMSFKVPVPTILPVFMGIRPKYSILDSTAYLLRSSRVMGSGAPWTFQ